MDAIGSYSRNFNRREVKWALRSDSAEVAQFMAGLPPLDMISLASKMYGDLRLPDFSIFLWDCREAVDLVEKHANDKREMLDAILNVIERFAKSKVIESQKKTNLGIATYMSLVRVTEISEILTNTADFHNGAA
jgi:hypothetical protein